MPRRMKIVVLQGLLWLYLYGFGLVAMSMEPGYLDFDNLPDTNFSCVGKVIGGYYADLETNCQMFHVCTIGQLDEPMDIRFLCLNGTVFDQETRVCERIDEVDCSKSEQFYSLNLELYGNTQPSIVEESPETDRPIIIKSTTTTTTTTPRPKTTRLSFFSTLRSLSTTPKPQVISTHHFPVSSGPDIRFNPAEINISLNPGAPPHIHAKPLFHQQILPNIPLGGGSRGKEAAEAIGFGPPHTQKRPPDDLNYSYTYDDESEDGTEPPQTYQYHHQHSFRPHPYALQQRRTTLLPATTQRAHPPATYQQSFAGTVKPRTEKPHRLQLPLPLLANAPSALAFSSPAPFALHRHADSKRFVGEHQSPPRIIISASASVSDASGRRLNYSLGTIGAAQILESPPATYDDYKDHDVGLDPFYHDVPKLAKPREKRSPPRIQHSDVIRSEEEAVDVLKFLFDWYQNQESLTKAAITTVSIPLVPETITEINDELSPSKETSLVDVDDADYNYRDDVDLAKRSKFNVVGDVWSGTDMSFKENMTTNVRAVVKSGDYVDDNYEPLIYKVNDKANDTDINKNDYDRDVAIAKMASKTSDYVYDNYEPLTYAVHEHVNETDKNDRKDALISNEYTTEYLSLTTVNDEKMIYVSNDVKDETTTIRNEETTTLITTTSKTHKRGRGRYRFSFDHDDDFNERKKSRNTSARTTTEVLPFFMIPETTTTFEKNEDISTNISPDATPHFYLSRMVDETTTKDVLKNKNDASFAEYVYDEEAISTTILMNEENQVHDTDSINKTLENYEETTTNKYIENSTVRNISKVSTKSMKTPTKHSQEYAAKQLEETTVINLEDYISRMAETAFMTSTTQTIRSNEQTVLNTENFQDSVLPNMKAPLTTTSEEPVTEEINETSITKPLEMSTVENMSEFTSLNFSQIISTTPFLMPNVNSEIYETIPTESSFVSKTESTFKINQEKYIKEIETTTNRVAVINLTPAASTTIESELETEKQLTPVESTTAKRRRTRPIHKGPTDNSRRTFSRHRFSTDSFSPRPNRRKHVDDNDALALTRPQEKEAPSTDAPLRKSVSATLAKSAKAALYTTLPYLPSKSRHRTFIFNCFGKPINKFYSDPRDCRLFHYCTFGYTKNQLLDLKFVCDLGTFFDDERLICANDKPARCL